MADAVDSKSTAGNGVGVQVPSRALVITGFLGNQGACFFENMNYAK